MSYNAKDPLSKKVHLNHSRPKNQKASNRRRELIRLQDQETCNHLAHYKHGGYLTADRSSLESDW